MRARLLGKNRWLLGAALAALGALPVWGQGPPYQTDDPVPVDYQHYEFYIFGVTDGTPVEMDAVAQAVEFNWGAIPRVQLHAILPLGVVAPLNHPAYAALDEGQGPTEFGLADTELGAKIAFIKESPRMPQIGSFTMFEMPTGSYDKGLGIGKVWYRLPLWLQKNFGHWLVDGGAGEAIVPQTDYRNFPYGGFLVKHTFGETMELGGEIVAHGREGVAAPQNQAATMIDLGGSYHFKHSEHQQLLFAYGHSVAGQTENYAYLGMYWTWGKDKGGGGDAGSGFQGMMGRLLPGR